MISARRGLMAHLREFFDRELSGRFNWDAVRHHPAEDAPLLARGRRNPLGKKIENVTISFGVDDCFCLSVSSPEHDPPLGWVTATHGSDVVEGALDISTWANIGQFIRGKTR